MILDVDPQAALPVYEQIREQVTRMVVSGVLPTGSRLPTIRQLAGDLKLAKGTVAKAYALLEQHGIVESRGHRGTFVLELAQPSDVNESLAEAVERFVHVARQLGVGQEQAVEQLAKRWAEQPNQDSV